MSNAALRWAFAQVSIRGPARVVLIALADQANAQGECWPSVRTIADRCGLGLTAVHAALKKLQAAGALTIVNRAEAGRSLCSIYHLPPTALRDADHVVQEAQGRVRDADPRVRDAKGGGSRGEGGRVREAKGGGSRGEDKPSLNPQREPSREPKEAAAAPPAPPAAAAPPPAGDLFGKPAGKAGPPAVTGQGDVEAAFQAWNQTAARCKLQPARLLTADRRKALRDRIRDVGGLEGFVQVLGTLEQSPFALGGGSRGWRITLDELLEPKKFINVAEGSYAEIRPEPAKPGSRLANLRDLQELQAWFSEEDETSPPADDPHGGPTIDGQAEAVWPH